MNREMNSEDIHKIFSGSNVTCDEIRINQRELIMKILARYSGQFTVLRELIQNANDSKADAYTIRLFPEKKQIHISHNGFVFRKQDWDRITTIASGNPDEDTIGCFGVGFYSVFSISEYPTIISGNQMLQFVHLIIRCCNLCIWSNPMSA